jgi:hypothetical protein
VTLGVPGVTDGPFGEGIRGAVVEPGDADVPPVVPSEAPLPTVVIGPSVVGDPSVVGEPRIVGDPEVPVPVAPVLDSCPNDDAAATMLSPAMMKTVLFFIGVSPNQTFVP